MIYTIYHIDGAIHGILEGDKEATIEHAPTTYTGAVTLDLTAVDYENANINWMIKDDLLVPPYLSAEVEEMLNVQVAPSKTFSWVNADGVTRELSYEKEDQNTTVQLKAWFDLGGYPRNWTFQNGEVVENVDATMFLSIVAAAMKQMAP